MTTRYVQRLIDGSWHMVQQNYGWKSKEDAEKVIPVYAWPDGGQILSIGIHTAESRDLCFVSGEETQSPVEITFDPLTREFVGNGDRVATQIRRYASPVLTFLHDCGVGFPEGPVTETGTRISSLSRFLNTEKLQVSWNWMDGGQFVGIDKEQVELELLLGNLPFPLLEFWKLEEKIREANGWEKK